MWSAPQTKEPIEKIRKAQWTVENTRKTQEIVDCLIASKRALVTTLGGETNVTRDIAAAILRFRQLDPKVQG